MFRRILLAVDAQRVADAAVPAVAQLAASSHVEVLVVHVRDIERGLRTRFEDEHLVDHVVARLRDAGVTARGEVRTIANGDVADAMLDSAGRFGPTSSRWARTGGASWAACYWAPSGSGSQHEPTAR
jgi:nucleotide-binding universal stress UspA family protein